MFVESDGGEATGQIGSASVRSAAREQEHEYDERYETHSSSDGMKTTPAFQQGHTVRRVGIQGAVEEKLDRRQDHDERKTTRPKPLGRGSWR
jgi:hypothetical protein